MLNGEIVDPGGIGIPASSDGGSGGGGGGGGGGGCFISTANAANLSGGWRGIAGALITLLIFMGIIRLRRN